MRIEIKTNAREVAAALGELAVRELPFASAKALTRVAQTAALAQQAQMRRAFKIRSQRVIKGVRYRPADKRDWPNQQALVGTLDEFIAQHEAGGRKRPRKGARRIAVPIERLVRRTASGALAKGSKPRVLVQKGRVQEREQALRGKVGRRKGAPFLAFYWLRPFVTLRPRLAMRQTVERVARLQHARIFRPVLEQAMRDSAARAARSAGRLKS